jgi:uncharacterized GH25 family protein
MKLLFTLLLGLVIITVSAHEFWLQPAKFMYAKGETANIRFRVGENFEGENWNNNRSKINFLTLYQNGTTADLAPLISDNKGDSLQLTLTQEGTVMVVYNGLNSFIELDKIKFNAYLEEDGLQEVIAYRKQYGETDSAGRESYQRSVKTILQVGNQYDSTFTQHTLLPLDIIPLTHPYKINRKQTMNLQVFFNNEPMTNSLVNIWHREKDKTVRIQKHTDQNGVISFPIKKTGAWMVSTVKMIRLTNQTNANWQSFWGSCTWGYQ